MHLLVINFAIATIWIPDDIIKVSSLCKSTVHVGANHLHITWANT